MEATPVETIIDGRSLADAVAESFRSGALNEETCRRALAELVRPEMTCPCCRVSLDLAECERLYSGRDIICKDCGRRHNLFSGTILCGLHISPSAIVTACLLRRFGARFADISRITGASESTISRLLDRLSVTVMQ